MATINQTETIVALALGSNLGDRLGALRAAMAALTPFFTVTRRSAIYETPPAYVTDQPPFLNAAVLGITRLPPVELLHHLKQIEQEQGRIDAVRYGPRLIDIDILFYGDLRMENATLALPHPRLAEREFALRPLADIAPDWRHPQTGLTVTKMLETLPEAARRLGEQL